MISEEALSDLRDERDLLVRVCDEQRAKIIALTERCDAYKEALAVPEVWSDEERDGMAAAFKRASERHGHYETLFAVAAWLLRHRAALATPQAKTT